MFGRMMRGIAASAFALLAAAALQPSGVAAQQSGPFRVLVPDFFAGEGANRNFGRDVAKELRELMRSLPGYTAIERDEIRDNLRRLDLDMEDLTCLSTRQLGPQINAAVAICMSYVEQGDDRSMSQIQIIDVGSGAILPIDDATYNRREQETAAQYIVDAFDTYVQQSRMRVFCFDYSSEQNQLWEDALRTCLEALELNPGDNEVRYQLGYVKYQQDDLEGALETVQEVLDNDPYHQEGLQLGGFVATTLGNQDQGRDYYQRYLELNPGAVDVRRRIAYDVARAGDPEAAVGIIQEGFAAGESIELTQDLANYSFAAARALLPEGFQPSEENPVPENVAAFYNDAIDAYLQVFEVRGDSMDVSQLRNVIVAQVQMNQLEGAASTAERVLEIFDGEAVIWATYADALRRLGRIDEAVEAYQAIEEIDPEYPDLFARQGQILIQAGRRDDAVPVLMRAVERGGNPNQLSRLIFADAYSNGVQKQQWSYALQGIQAAKSFEGLADASVGELDFWHGFVQYNRGIQVCRCGPDAPGGTVETAEAALPIFQEAKALLGSAGSTAYAEGRNLKTNQDQLLNGADQYIEMQGAIIRRGR